MRISKISSKATYHKCLKNLHSLGYINYEPSYNPFKGSHVILFNFSDDLKPLPKSERKPKNEPLIELVSEQALNKSCTSSETGTEQAVVPSINYINNTNILNDKNVANLEKHTKNFEEINNSDLKNETEEIQTAFADTNKKQTENSQQKEKSSAKKEKEEMLETLDDDNRQMLQTFANSDENQIKNSWQKSSAKKEKDESCHTELVEVSHNQKSNPVLEEVKSYFQENNFPEQEAQKFFNYFKSVGWLVGGKTPMVDWQAAAQNWMINAQKFISNEQQPNRAKQLNTTTDKDYSEPL